MRVFVYYNFHKKCWSVKALEGPDKGRVIHRSENVLLGDVTSKVSEAGRQRVLREKRKSVHAGLVGELLSLEEQDFIGRKLSYNPYRNNSFVFAHSQLPFSSADQVCLSTTNGVRAGIPA